MKRAQKKKLKRISKAASVAFVMIAFSATLYFSQMKNVKVNYLGDVITFRTMAKTVAEAFEEKSIIISDGLVVSKEINSELLRNDEIFIDAPQILASVDTTVVTEQVPVQDTIKQETENKNEIEEIKKDSIDEKKIEKKTETKPKVTSRATTKPRTWYDDTKEVEPGVIETSDGKKLEYTGVIQMEATAYCACYSCCGKYPSNKYYGVTKTGTRAKVGTIAVDPRKIPLGKSLYIEGLSGAQNYGFGKAEDIGGAIKGNIIDLYFDTHEETIKWGRQQVKVYILK